MAEVKFKMGESSRLSNIEKDPGSIIVTTDD